MSERDKDLTVYYDGACPLCLAEGSYKTAFECHMVFRTWEDVDMVVDRCIELQTRKRMQASTRPHIGHPRG